ncbi:MAG: NTP transferase domain-containing protein [Actinomycetota bacterium]|nr:NTP transferase domain-containing protein [Actinomycetota bacterium]
MAELVVDTAVIPLAGLATRMQPIARSVPKEMLPLGDRPVLHYVVEELVNAGVEHIVLVVGARSEAIERYFHHLPDLDKRLDQSGNGRGRDPLWQKMARCSFSFVLQDEPLGITDAVRRAQPVVRDRWYFVHMGDSIIWHDAGLLRRMIYCQAEASVDATIAVSRSLPHCSSTRAIAEPAAGVDPGDQPYDVARITEAEERQQGGWPTQPFVIGRYLLKGPMPSRSQCASDSGKFGGFTPWLSKGSTASVRAVSLLETEHLLGAGTLAEYQTSWRRWLEEVGR